MARAGSCAYTGSFEGRSKVHPIHSIWSETGKGWYSQRKLGPFNPKKTKYQASTTVLLLGPFHRRRDWGSENLCNLRSLHWEVPELEFEPSVCLPSIIWPILGLTKYITVPDSGAPLASFRGLGFLQVSGEQLEPVVKQEVIQLRRWKIRKKLCCVLWIWFLYMTNLPPENLGRADRHRASSLGGREGAWTCHPNMSLGSLLLGSVLGCIGNMRQVGWFCCPRGWGWQLPAVEPGPLAPDTERSPGRRSVGSQTTLPQAAVLYLQVLDGNFWLHRRGFRWDIHSGSIKFQRAHGEKCILSPVLCQSFWSASPQDFVVDGSTSQHQITTLSFSFWH